MIAKMVKIVTCGAAVGMIATAAAAGPGDWCRSDCVAKCNAHWGVGTDNAKRCISTIVNCNQFPASPCAGTQVKGYIKKKG